MKPHTILLVAFTFAVSACGSAPSATVDDQSASASSSSEQVMAVSSEATSVATTSSAVMMQQNSSPAIMRKSSSAHKRVISIVASNFAFAPNAITVKKGEKVTLRITSSEGIHGFGIPDMGINERVAPGDTIDITLDTSVAGTFAFRCTVPCGPGHQDMTGTITIG